LCSVELQYLSRACRCPAKVRPQAILSHFDPGNGQGKTRGDVAFLHGNLPATTSAQTPRAEVRDSLRRSKPGRRTASRCRVHDSMTTGDAAGRAQLHSPAGSRTAQTAHIRPREAGFQGRIRHPLLLQVLLQHPAQPYAKTQCARYATAGRRQRGRAQPSSPRHHADSGQTIRANARQLGLCMPAERDSVRSDIIYVIRRCSCARATPGSPRR
jgi:hypothetical protein